MLILHIITDLRTGGAELMLKRLAESHVGTPGYTHRVISLRSLGTVGPQLQASGIEVEALGIGGVSHLPAAVSRLRRRIKELRPDVVQTWMYHADLIGGLAARAAGRRQVIWGVRIADIARDIGVARATLLVRRACALLSRRVPARIVYVAEASRRVHEALGYDRVKGLVIPNGYAVPPGAPAGRGGSPIRQALGIGADAFLIGTAGRFSDQKNQRGFIAACGAVAARAEQASFLLFGPGVTADNPELSRWIEATGYRDRFHILGERRDVNDCLAALDLFCLPSREEGFPNIVAEAMMVGVPCLVTDVGDAALLVGDTGFVVPPRDQAALDAALLRLAGTSRAELIALGERARQRMIGAYSMDRIREMYERLYQELAGAEPASAKRAAPAGAAG